MIVKKRIGDLSDKVIHQNIFYLKHLNLSMRCVKTQNYITTIKKYFAIFLRSGSCDSIYNDVERANSLSGVSDVDTLQSEQLTATLADNDNDMGDFAIVDLDNITNEGTHSCQCCKT